MTVIVTENEWSPAPGSLPADPEVGVVYVIPTRRSVAEEGVPRYTDQVRFLPKAARAVGAPVTFSMPEGSRRYLQEFSGDPDQWALGLAVLGMANEWLIFTVGQFIDLMRDRQGWTAEQAQRRPLKVSVVELDESAGISRTITAEGEAADVIDALRELQSGSSSGDAKS
ncbi:hypothetical protein [Leifsonia poae]|uniref:Uncharacterized protein n=1 Tax=Leifsonia poae TaxID=110933 RepID=A0A9W6H7F3_9MICO|nr:hypothetical protein [Leifsonia poae]GLJ74757.1 hypothetical protein GCM10017584_03300 [Leifsonia poae]